MNIKLRKYQWVLILLLASTLFVLGLFKQDLTYTLFALLMGIFVEKFGHNALFNKKEALEKEVYNEKSNLK